MTHFVEEAVGKQTHSHVASRSVNHYNTHIEQLGDIYQQYKYALCPGSPASIIFLTDSLMQKNFCALFVTEKDRSPN